ncbi:methyltransferase [Aquibium sp. ELW1220]|uniref:tRNA1(Val) (adenine(37)-N6)-methyltransferase n=1 Tax=Aquibium sp. ELW1220 TaxID=2976766 RepID=UPI0025B2491F|nr:methyltransferase [Aquibium sp. ELW1220]MDN2583690.1 methyltransferase [Aquibium sp. ELW1220]
MSATAAEASIDAFHRGRFFLAQPLHGGHRAGMDAMMLAAAVPSDFRGLAADLGSGAGGAGLAVLARCLQARALLVEREPAMAAFARLTLALEANADLAARASLLVADVSLAGRARMEAGLADRSVDLAIMNPPFNEARDRQTPDGLRKAAHVMDEGLLERWIRTAAAIVKPSGTIALIARPQSLSEILDAMAGRFGALDVKPIHPRPDADAIRVVVRGLRGSRRAMRLAAPLVLHEADGNRFTAEADAICNGLASLFRD